MTLKTEFYESRVQGARRMFRNDEGFEMVQEVFTDLKETHLNPRPLESCLPAGRLERFLITLA